MEESRRNFMIQCAKRVTLSAGGVALLSSADISAAGLQRYHVVKKNENLTVIARRYGVTVNNLKLWNGLASDVIMPGQKLHLRVQHSSLPLATINRPKNQHSKMEKYNCASQCNL